MLGIAKQDDKQDSSRKLPVFTKKKKKKSDRFPRNYIETSGLVSISSIIPASFCQGFGGGGGGDSV